MHSARVSAWNILSKIMGYEAPKKVEATVELTGGVMVVAATPDMVGWESAASGSQQKLKEIVRD